MKTILVHIHNDGGQEARLQAAFDIARACDGHVTCMEVTPYAAYSITEPVVGAIPITAMIEAIDAERREERQRVEARMRDEGVRWDWLAREGESYDRLSDAARLADVVVMSAGPADGASLVDVMLAGEVAIHAPAPVVAVSPLSHGFAVNGGALVAWDGSQEAGMAMRAALPLLRLAETVELLTVSEKDSQFRARDAATWLSRHGVSAEVLERHDDGRGVEQVIRDVVAERRSAWLVMGAYGHSRLREMLFGGVTRALLARPPVPLLLAH